MKKIAIIGSVGIPAKYGGFETLVEYLTFHLHTHYEITVYCSSKNYQDRPDQYNGCKLEYLPLHANGVQSIPYDIWSIAKAVRHHDTILLLGVAGCFSIPFFRLFYRRKFIVNVDGTEWKRDKWGKVAKRYLRNAERFAARYADTLIADNPVIKKYMDETYQLDCVFIPYGGDQVTTRPLSESTRKKYSIVFEKYACKVCRIEPENNVHLVLEAFKLTPKENLVLVGNWEYSEYGQNLYNQYRSFPNILLLSPIYDQNELNEIRSNCVYYIHGHSAGGTNPSLVEAMHLERHVLAFDVDYNRATTENAAIYFNSTEALIAILQTSLSEKNGEKMKEIANRLYTWKGISEQYADLF